MEIFAVLFLILKIIGVVLGAALLLLIIFMTILLWGSVRYDICAEKADRFNMQTTVGFIGIFKFIFLYQNEKTEYYLKILWFKFFFGNSGKNADEEVNDEKFETIKNENEDIEKNRNAFDAYEKTDIGEDLNDNIKADVGKTKRKFGKKKKKRKNNNYNKGKNIYDKILYFKNYPERDIIIKYTVNLIKDLFEGIKPEYFEVNMIVGFDDPFHTGCFLGAASVVSAFLPFKINVWGEFDKKIFKCDLKTKGKTNVFKVGFPVLKYILKKPVLKIIKKWLH